MHCIIIIRSDITCIIIIRSIITCIIIIIITCIIIRSDITCISVSATHTVGVESSGAVLLWQENHYSTKYKIKIYNLTLQETVSAILN